MQIGFIVAVALLLAIVAAIVLPPLWRGARTLAIALAVTLPIMAVSLYALLGTPAALDPTQLHAAPSLDAQIDALAQRMRAHPDDVDGWVLLGRSRREQQRYADALQAYRQALRLAPKEPALMVEVAETMALATADHRLDDDALTLLQSARNIDPSNQRALWFLGIAQYQRKDYAGAANTWQPLLTLAPPDTRTALRQQIDGARAKAGLPPLPAAAAAPTLLTVHVDISAALRAQIKPEDVLFVFARAVSGPPMPLAVKRVPAKDLPLTITLSDDDGPMPTLRLSQQKTVTVVARVSHSGQATAQSGDFEATAVTATVGDKQAIAIIVDHTHP